jgi:hypothetical protein
VPGSEKKRDSVLKQLHLMKDFFGMMAESAPVSEQRDENRSIANSLGRIATTLNDAFCSADAGETTPVSTKSESQGVPVAKGRKRRVVKAVPKPTATPKGSRSTRGVKRKGKKQSSQSE